MFFQFVVHVTHSFYEDPSLTLLFVIFLACATGFGQRYYKGAKYELPQHINKNTTGITDGVLDLSLELTCRRGVFCRWRE